jgi:hypothetical protein
MLLADYPFLEAMWTVLVFCAWVIWFWILITVLADVFRRRDIGGGKKTLWTIFMILTPFLGVFVYLISQGGHMAEREAAAARARQEDFDQYVRSAAGSGGASAEIERAKALLDSGAITPEEYEQLKKAALA